MKIFFEFQIYPFYIWALISKSKIYIMNQIITNTDERRLSMAYFAGLFLLAVAIPCLAFTNSFRVAKEIPKAEMDRLVEKQQIVLSLSELGNLLRQYETEQLSGSLNAEMKDAEVTEKMVTIRRQLLHKDTVVAYADVRKLLDMATQYRNFIKRTAKEGDQKTQEYIKQIADLQNKINMSELDKKAAQIDQKSVQVQMQEQALQNAKKNNASGGGGAVAPPPAYNPAPQPIIIPANTNTGDANCDAKVNQIKASFRQIGMQLRTPISQIRADVSSISKGLFGKNSSEKQRIEGNLKQVEQQLDALNN